MVELWGLSSHIAAIAKGGCFELRTVLHLWDCWEAHFRACPTCGCVQLPESLPGEGGRIARRKMETGEPFKEGTYSAEQGAIHSAESATTIRALGTALRMSISLVKR